eukprot:6457951-Amphidinium_carterae.1
MLFPNLPTEELTILVHRSGVGAAVGDAFLPGLLAACLPVPGAFCSTVQPRATSHAQTEEKNHTKH